MATAVGAQPASGRIEPVFLKGMRLTGVPRAFKLYALSRLALIRLAFTPAYSCNRDVACRTSSGDLRRS